MNKRYLILMLFVFLLAVTVVSAEDNDTSVIESENGELSEDVDAENIIVDEEVLGDGMLVESHDENHYVTYVDVGKYRVKVWSDDSLKVEKQKVLKTLKKKIKKPHTFKIKGYKFKVSAKKYIKILYYKKYELGGVMFKAKTNKCQTVKAPIYNKNYDVIGYKTLTLRVYAIGHQTHFKPYVAFRAIGKGVNQYAGDGYYYPL